MLLLLEEPTVGEFHRGFGYGYETDFEPYLLLVRVFWVVIVEKPKHILSLLNET